MKKPEIERIGFSVIADKDECPHVFSHADRFLIVDLKYRKEVIAREYRPNPYGKICREKFPKPAFRGEPLSDEEKELYQKISEIVKDCDYVLGRNFGNSVVDALKAAGTDFLMNSLEPQEWIDSLIEARYAAGYRD